MNLFVTVNYQVDSMYGNTNYEDYKKLTQLCVESFKKNLIGLDSAIILEGKVANYHELFKEVYSRVREIYFSGFHNILFADSDTICLKPIKIFGKFDKFSMFLIANQFHQAFGSQECRKLAGPLYPWMMANLRYYPSEMNSNIWNVGDAFASDWIEDWAYDCIIYNAMFHAQAITDYEKYHIPEWNTLVVGGITDQQIKNSAIIHCAATRGSSLSLENINKALGRS